MKFHIPDDVVSPPSPEADSVEARDQIEYITEALDNLAGLEESLGDLFSVNREEYDREISDPKGLDELLINLQGDLLSWRNQLEEFLGETS